MALTTETQTQWYSQYYMALDGSCLSAAPKLLSSSKLEVEKRPRERRVKPQNLLANLTNRPLQYIARTSYGKGHDTTFVVMPPGSFCAGKPCRFEADYPLSGAWIPQPAYPADNWQLGIRQKIAGEQVSFAENIGEYRESVEALEGLGNILKRSGYAARRIWRNRKSRFKLMRQVKREFGEVQAKTPREWQDVIGTYLAVQFGVAPALGQVDDVLTALDRVKQRKVRVVSTTKVHATKTHTVSGYVGEAVSTGEKTQRAVVYVTFRDTHGNFTAGNLGSSIWAGVPLSFMVDWAIDVGGYLESLTALDGVQSVLGTVTTKERLRTVSTLRPPQRKLVDPFVRSYSSVQRIVVNSIPLPSRLRVRIPSWDFGKFVSSLAMFASMRHNRR